MIAHLRMLIYGFCLAIALMCGIASFTILAAIVTHKLSDSEAWTAVVFFAAVGGFSWMAGRAVRSG
jgi:hypothetical protein